MHAPGPSKTIPTIELTGFVEQIFYLYKVWIFSDECRAFVERDPHAFFGNPRKLRRKRIWHAGNLLAIGGLEGLLQKVGMKSFGAIVIVLGIVMTTLTGFNIITKKKVADLGSVEITKEEKTPVYWSPITGGVLIVVGLVLVIAGKKKI